MKNRLKIVFLFVEKYQSKQSKLKKSKITPSIAVHKKYIACPLAWRASTGDSLLVKFETGAVASPLESRPKCDPVLRWFFFSGRH